VKEEKMTIRCSDVMKPIEAPSRCMLQDSATRAAQAMRDSGLGFPACG
jgi:hypothetical protein